MVKQLTVSEKQGAIDENVAVRGCQRHQINSFSSSKDGIEGRT